MAEKYIRDLNADAQPKLFGQDWNDEAWAVCKSDMLIKGEDAAQPVKLLNASAVKEGVARMFAAGATMIVTIGATLGKVSSLTEAGSCNQQITVIEFDQRRIHSRFATYQLKRLEPALRAIAPSATLPILDQGEIADIALGIPPLAEQAAIAAYLDLETAKLDTLVGKVELAVEQLQEYRTALITAAVTGKIDVRTAKR